MPKWALRILVPVLAVIAALVIAEIGLRIYYRATFTGTLEDAMKSPTPAKGETVTLKSVIEAGPNPRLPYQLRPNLDVEFLSRPLKTNSQGWREVTLPEPKEDNEFRIVGIGDSVMFGWGVSEDERYMDLLENDLQESMPERRWTTVSLAVPGYNLVMELEALERFGLAYEPDMIIYGFVANDFCVPNFLAGPKPVLAPVSFIDLYLNGDRPARRRRRAAPEADFDPPEENATRPGRALRGMFPRPLCTPEETPPQYHPLLGIRGFVRAARAVTKIAEDRGIPLIVVSHRWGRTDDLRRLFPDGVKFLDVTPHFSRYVRREGYESLRESDLVVSPRDAHPSAQGHRLIADQLFPALQEWGVLDAPEPAAP